MSAVAEAWVVKHSPYTGSTFHVHKAIGEIVNKERRWLFYGRLTELAKKTRMDRKTIASAIARLVDDGYLVTERSPMIEVELNGLVKSVPTGRPGVYRFVFVRGAAVMYDAEGTDLSADEASGEGGEESASPPVSVIPEHESQPGVSAGHSVANPLLFARPLGGEEISSPRPGGGESASPGEEISSRGGESAARNCIESHSELEIPPTPRTGGSGSRSAGTNPRALGTAPRDAGTNPRATTIDWLFGNSDTPPDEPTAIADHVARAHAFLGGDE